LVFSAVPVLLQRPRDADKLLPATLAVNIVRVHEIDVPAGERPVEWWLVTNEPIDTPEQVAATVDAYRARWRIEEFFMAVKTGCSYEARQLESLPRLLNLLAVTLPIAYRLLLLKHLARDQAKTPAIAVFTDVQLRVLRAKAAKPLPKNMTVGEALLAVAALGGHIKNNGHPGWRVIWRGMRELLFLELGWTYGWQARDAELRSVES
jgi:hypothetical protein